MDFKVDPKTRLVELYDTIDKKVVKVSVPTAREIMQHPQQRGKDGPRFITIEANPEQDRAQAIADKAREMLEGAKAGDQEKFDGGENGHPEGGAVVVDHRSASRPTKPGAGSEPPRRPAPGKRDQSQKAAR